MEVEEENHRAIHSHLQICMWSSATQWSTKVGPSTWVVALLSYPFDVSYTTLLQHIFRQAKSIQTGGPLGLHWSCVYVIVQSGCNLGQEGQDLND